MHSNGVGNQRVSIEVKFRYGLEKTVACRWSFDHLFSGWRIFAPYLAVTSLATASCYWLIDWLISRLIIRRLSDWLIDFSFDWLIDWFSLDWLIDWLIFHPHVFTGVSIDVSWNVFLYFLNVIFCKGISKRKLWQTCFGNFSSAIFLSQFFFLFYVGFLFSREKKREILSSVLGIRRSGRNSGALRAAYGAAGQRSRTAQVPRGLARGPAGGQHHGPAGSDCPLAEGAKGQVRERRHRQSHSLLLQRVRHGAATLFPRAHAAPWRPRGISHHPRRTAIAIDSRHSPHWTTSSSSSKIISTKCPHRVSRVIPVFFYHISKRNLFSMNIFLNKTFLGTIFSKLKFFSLFPLFFWV